MPRFEMRLTLNEIKRRLVEDMFPSKEDGNPDDYEIEIEIDKTMHTTVIVIRSKKDK